MRGTAFAFESLLDVYQIRERSIEGEIASLEHTQTRIQQGARSLFEKCDQTHQSLAESGSSPELFARLRFIEGARQKIREFEEQVNTIQLEIESKRDALKQVRLERLRFDKLKERHQREMIELEKKMEQRRTDEFAQRKEIS